MTTDTATEKDLYELGETPPLGYVPKQMYASLIRPERFGEPNQAFEIEAVDSSCRDRAGLVHADLSIQRRPSGGLGSSSLLEDWNMHILGLDSSGSRS